MSPDLNNDTSHVKAEVENIRDAINGNDKIPIATFLQLHDTSDARTKIKDAVGHGTYAKGTPVPGDINVRLHANKEDSLLGILNVGVVPQAESVDIGKSEADENADTSMKKDLSNPNDPDEVHPIEKEREPIGIGWIKHRLHMKENHQKPLVLRDPTINTVLQLPLWFKLRRGFMRNVFSSRRE